MEDKAVLVWREVAALGGAEAVLGGGEADHLAGAGQAGHLLAELQTKVNFTSAHRWQMPV